MTRFLSGLARFRRGPWEMLATILIGLGVVMLMQPFFLWAFTWSFVVTLVGTVMFIITSHFPSKALAEIVIRNLRKEFGEFVAVKGSTFTVGDGEFFMLLGPSGCGKTTTLRMIAGLELPTSGEILIDGEDVSQKPASQRDIAFVFQMFALYPHLNVRKNISYPLVSQGLPRAQVQAKVAEVARILGIESILDKPVGGLSGGDRQRVALAAPSSAIPRPS